MTADTTTTRARLIAAAERLFAEKGVEGTALNEIGKAAGQRNVAACQYHFGTRNDLIQAILDKHTPAIAKLRDELLDAADRARKPALRAVVHAYVAPVAAKLDDPDGGPEFIRINAQLLALHAMHYHHLGPYPLRAPRTERLTRALTRCLAPRRLPDPVLKQRLIMSSIMLFHSLADHSRIVALSDRKAASTDTALFVANLEDSITAMLTAKVSTATTRRLSSNSRPLSRRAARTQPRTAARPS